MTTNHLNVGILGASGYTGAELVRILANHDHTHIRVMTADRHANQDYSAVYPHLSFQDLPSLQSIEDAALGQRDLDVIFCGLPHGTTQEIIKSLLPEKPNAATNKGPRIIDLSADFRLRNVDTYAEWYGHPHYAPALQKYAVYGLSEAYRRQLADAQLVACPGCFPTGILLPLLPLLEAKLIDPARIIVDAKTGVTGAGRAVKQAMLYGEVAEGLHAYGIAGHRHLAELEQELKLATGETVPVTFIPHLAPMNRGILSTIYVDLQDGVDVDALHQCLNHRYLAEPFVYVMPQGAVPSTRQVRGSNFCAIGIAESRIPGRALIVSAIDNLVKGSSGQAVQNMNIMFDLPEGAGLQQLPLFP